MANIKKRYMFVPCATCNRVIQRRAAFRTRNGFYFCYTDDQICAFRTQPEMSTLDVLEYEEYCKEIAQYDSLFPGFNLPITVL
jgi:hypothetical protein